MELDNRLVSGLGLSNSRIINVHDIDSSPAKRRKVVEELRKVEIQYWDELASLLAKDQSSKVRRKLAASVGARGCREGLSILEKLASDGDWRVRREVALALQNYDLNAVLFLFFKLLPDENAEVRKAAGVALLKGPMVRNPEATSNLLDNIRYELSGINAKYHGSLVDEIDKRNVFIGSFGLGKPFKSKVTGPQLMVKLDNELFKDINLLNERPVGVQTLADSRMEGKLPNAGTQPIRYVNSWFLGHPDPLTPLRFGQVYELGIQVSPILLVGTFTSGELEFHEQDFGDADVLDVKLALVTEDFEIMDKAAKNMILPRDINRESSIVKFKVKPIKNNQDVFITVLFYRDNNLFQEALIGARIQVTNSIAEDKVTAYFPTENRFLAPIGGHRDINIQIKGFNDFYRFTLFYDFGNDQFDVMSCTIPINRSRVADFVKGVRENLLNVVNTKATLSNKKTGMIFYEPCDAPLEEGRLPELYSIEDNICDQSLQTLAKAGRYLYVNLFYSTKGSRRERERTARIGEALRKLSNDRSLRIQVLSDDFFIPWNLFYDGAYPAEKVNPYEFWGFKHVIEEIPYRTSEEEPKDATSIEKNQLRIGMNISRTIQKELTDPQLSFVKNIGSMGKSFERSKEEEVVAALQGMTEECQLEYFYCHAGTEGESQRNFDQSYIGLTRDDEGLTLEDIKLATAGCRFKGNPIFILNACESAQMDGRFYDGFVPQFLSMGACSVVGTDCELPSLFGAHFGILLLDALLRGNPIGDILLELRRHFLKKYKNPLGMIYRVFGNADAHLSNPITIEN